MGTLEAIVTILAALITGLCGVIVVLIKQKYNQKKDLKDNWVQKDIYDCEVERGKEILKLYLDFIPSFDAWCVKMTQEFAEVDKQIQESGSITAQNVILLTQSLNALKETVERLTLRLINGKIC